MPRSATKEDKEDLAKYKALEAMLASEGWKIYEKFIRLHMEQKINQSLAPLGPIPSADGMTRFPDGVTHVLLGEAAKGAIMGMRLCLEFPHATVVSGKQLHQDLFGTPSDEE